MSAALAAAPAIPRTPKLRPAPRREPPFDDELPRPRLQLVHGQDQELPFPEPATPIVEPLTRPPGLPDPGAWATRLLVGLSESAAGRRPLNQMAGLLTPGVFRGISQDFERANAQGSRHWLHSAIVRNVHTSEPAPGVADQV